MACFVGIETSHILKEWCLRQTYTVVKLSRFVHQPSTFLLKNWSTQNKVCSEVNRIVQTPVSCFGQCIIVIGDISLRKPGWKKHKFTLQFLWFLWVYDYFKIKKLNMNLEYWFTINLCFMHNKLQIATY